MTGLVLVGMPGCGKSTIGRHVARALGWRFVDADTEIERRIGTTIRAFFEREGEAAFREVEQPASFYVLRMTGETGKVALFEGDGGAWKLNAIARVRDWLVRDGEPS